MEALMESFPEKVYDVTNVVESCKYLWLGLVTVQYLELQSDEVVLRTRNCCFSSALRRPYSQLTLLEERSRWCGLASAINSDLSPIDSEGSGGLVPGCGCEGAYIKEILRELNLRKEGRGKAALLKQQKCMMQKMAQLAVQLPLLMAHLGVDYPPDEALLKRLLPRCAKPLRPLAEVVALEPMRTFDDSEYDVTSCWERLQCSSRRLVLQPDEATVIKEQFITGSTMIGKIPYSNIASVDGLQACCCCSMLTAGELTKPPGDEHIDEAMYPGCCCNGEVVEQIRADLQARVEARGHLGLIKQLEAMMSKFHDLSAQVVLVLDSLGLETAYPPSQEMMTDIYGQDVPDREVLSKQLHEEPSAHFETREFNVRNDTSNLFFWLLTCGLIGCATHTLTLEPDQAITRYANACSESVDRRAYAHVGNVDEGVCCCIHAVNGLSPGWCGDPDSVQDIAQELRNRRAGRGTTAQLRNQENSLAKAVETDIRTNILLASRGVQYPPKQQTLASMYGATAPRLPPAELQWQSLEANSSEPMQVLTYDVTNVSDTFCCCGLTETLELTDEEVILRWESPWLLGVRRQPYGTLGSVEPVEAVIGLCHSVNTDADSISPGCGCSAGLVKEISTELHNRKVKRGSIAQQRLQENLLLEIVKLGIKYDLLLHQGGIPYPPDKERTEAVFGTNVGLPLVDPTLPPPRRSRFFTQAAVPSGLRAGDAFVASSPTGRVSVIVPPGAREGHVVQVEIPSVPAGGLELAPLASS